MGVVRTFHPIGQGAFYSERFFFYEGEQLKANHNVVYDCGVCFGQEKKAKHVVTQAFTDKDEIDYLFISHLDYDHLSLAHILLPIVKNIVLPLVSEEELVIAMIYHQIEEREEAVEFFREVIDRLDKRDDNKTVIFIGGDDDKHGPNALQSGTNIKTAWDPDWVLIPHNIRYCSRRNELINELGNVISDQSIQDTIKKKGLDTFEDAEGLIEKLKGKDFAEKVIVIPDLRRAIKRAYSRIEGGTNENSLLLYSGPIRMEAEYRIEYCEPHRAYWYYEYRRVACLYTGDSTCDMADWQKKYSGVWGLVGTIQLPHHGSVESFDVEVNQIGRRYEFLVSFGTYNTYGHPSGKVLAYLMACECGVQMVTEMANSGYMQMIEKRRAKRERGQVEK